MNAKMITLDDIKDLETAADEKAFYKIIDDNLGRRGMTLYNDSDGLYVEYVDYTAPWLSNEDLAEFLSIDISEYSSSEDCDALQDMLSHAYQMHEDEVDAHILWLARVEIIGAAREVFEDSHLYTDHEDDGLLTYIEPSTLDEMRKHDIKTSANALRPLGAAVKGLAAIAMGEEGELTTIPEVLQAIELVSKYAEEVTYEAAYRFGGHSATDFMEYTGTDEKSLYTVDWGSEIRYLVSMLLGDVAEAGDLCDIYSGAEKLSALADFVQNDNFARVYDKDDAMQALSYALSAFIDFASKQEQDSSELQSLKTRLAENSARAFDKTFRTSLAEELQKLVK